jgi:hypothetical protein
LRACPTSGSLLVDHRATSRGVYETGRGSKERPPLDWKSAQWLPVYLIGLGIISWQGQFSGGAVAAPVNTGNIPFWWDMLVVAIFSLIIYYWAMTASLSRAEMLDLVGRQSGPVEHVGH